MGKNHQARHRRIRSNDWMSQLQRNQRQQKGHKPTQIVAECKLKKCLRITPDGTRKIGSKEGGDHEAVLEEIRSSRVTTAAPKVAASTSHELRENAIEPDPSPKKIQVMRSALAAANGSGQQRVKRSATDTEAEAQIGVPMEMGTHESAVLLKRSVRSIPVPITTPEAVDGYRVKKQHHGVVNHG